MPKWKYFANLFLTMLANATFYVFLSEYHSGLRAYSRRYLDAVDLERNAEGFVFDTEIIAQGVWAGMRIREVPIQTRYFPEASQIGFWRSVRLRTRRRARAPGIQVARPGVVPLPSSRARPPRDARLGRR